MIRLAQPADEPAVRKCAENAYARYVPDIGRRPAPMDADFLALIVAGHTHISVGEDGELQGFIVFYPEDACMLLESVAVLPQATGRGVGKALIQLCEHTAQQRGLHAVRLYTHEKMTDNLAIYPRLGYQEVDRRTESGFNRVFFEKVLPSL